MARVAFTRSSAAVGSHVEEGFRLERIERIRRCSAWRRALPSTIAGQLYLGFGFFPSKFNPGDDPSRGRFSELKARGG